jgi:hypothetical protein
MAFNLALLIFLLSLSVVGLVPKSDSFVAPVWPPSIFVATPVHCNNHASHGLVFLKYFASASIA